MIMCVFLSISSWFSGCLIDMMRTLGRFSLSLLFFVLSGSWKYLESNIWGLLRQPYVFL